MTSLRRRIAADVESYFSDESNKGKNYFIVVDSEKKAENYWKTFPVVKEKAILVTDEEFLWETTTNYLDRVALDNKKSALRTEIVEALNNLRIEAYV